MPLAPVPVWLVRHVPPASLVFHRPRAPMRWATQPHQQAVRQFGSGRKRRCVMAGVGVGAGVAVASAAALLGPLARLALLGICPFNPTRRELYCLPTPPSNLPRVLRFTVRVWYSAAVPGGLYPSVFSIPRAFRLRDQTGRLAWAAPFAICHFSALASLGFVPEGFDPFVSVHLAQCLRLTGGCHPENHDA